MIDAALFHSLFDRSPVGEYLLSPTDDPVILAVNQTFLKTVGRTREDLVGQRLFAVFPADPADVLDTGVPALQASLRRVISTRAADALPMQRYPIAVRRADGSDGFEERYWSATSTPVVGSDGALACISHRTEDVTEKWRMETALQLSRARTEAALRISRLGEFEWNFRTGEVHHSVRCRQIFGFDATRGQAPKDYFERIHPDDLPHVDALMKASLQGDGHVHQRFRVLQPDGTLRHVESMAVSERGADGAWQRHVGVMRDVTDSVLREEALAGANRRKDEFLAMLAHELRNPLAPIAAAAYLLQRTAADPARVKKNADVIIRQVRHMTGLVDDLLDVSRVTRGVVQLQKVALDLHHTVLEAVEQVRPLIEARRHALTLHISPEPAQVHADAKRLVQVVTNLLANAAKYTPEGGRITVRLEADDGSVRLDVDDTGHGMSAELLGSCFQLFVQAERASDRAAGGLGIGLALVKSLVELHGGSVTAESAGPGLGSRFAVTLPRLVDDAAPASAAPAGADAGAAGAARLKVLIVDDNQDAAEMLGLLVDALGHEAVLEQHPRPAIERVALEPPDVCLLDIGLPDMDGFELAREIRRRLGPARVTLVAITGYGQPEDRQNALRAGFDEHFAKPVDGDRLAVLLTALAAPGAAEAARGENRDAPRRRGKTDCTSPGTPLRELPKSTFPSAEDARADDDGGQPGSGGNR